MPNRPRCTPLRTISAAGTIAIVALVLVFPIGCSGGAETEAARISVEEIVNQVETDRPRDAEGGVSSFLPAQVGQELLTGDGVKTLPGSEARVDIVIREVLRITRTTPNTIWRLGRFALDRDTIIELEQGKLFLLDDGFRADRRPVRVVTPAGTASPRGTWMSVEYSPESAVVEVECFRGTCELENDLGSQILTDQQKSTATAQTVPTEPVYLEQQEILAFTELPEAKRGELIVPTPEVVPPTITPTPVPTPTPPSAVTLDPASMPVPDAEWLAKVTHLFSPVPEKYGRAVFLDLQALQNNPNVPDTLKGQALAPLIALPPGAANLLDAIVMAFARDGEALVVLSGPIEIESMLQVLSSLGIATEGPEPEAYRDHIISTLNISPLGGFVLNVAFGSADETTTVMASGSLAGGSPALEQIKRALDGFDRLAPRLLDDPEMLRLVANLAPGIAAAVTADCADLSNLASAPALPGCNGAALSFEISDPDAGAINAVLSFQDDLLASEALQRLKEEGFPLGDLLLEQMAIRQEGSLLRLRLAVDLGQIASALGSLAVPVQ